MPLLFADTDWAALGTAAIAVLGVLGGGVAWLAKFLTDRKSEREQKQRDFDSTQAEKQRVHELQFREHLAAMAARYETLFGEMRTESRTNQMALLAIQRETIETVSESLGKFGTELHGLALAISELRQQLDRKQDRPGR